jgi:hypothetical protein
MIMLKISPIAGPHCGIDRAIERANGFFEEFPPLSPSTVDLSNGGSFRR